MKKIILTGKVLLLTFAFASCTVTRIYPGMLTGASSLKEGKAEKKVWFRMASNIDVSIATAAKNGGITKVATVDYGYRKGLFSVTYITKVTGE